MEPGAQYWPFEMCCIHDAEMNVCFHYHPGNEKIEYLPSVLVKKSVDYPPRVFFPKRDEAFKHFTNEIQTYIREKRIKLNSGLRFQYYLKTKKEWLSISNDTARSFGLSFYIN